MNNFNNYIAILNRFYSDLAYWRYAKDTNGDDLEDKLSALQKSAFLLLNEIKNLPPDMVRHQVVEHAKKALAL